VSSTSEIITLQPLAFAVAVAAADRGIFFLLAFGMILRWRVSMYLTYRRILGALQAAAKCSRPGATSTPGMIWLPVRSA
jgi:membrane protein CcdC involved in cytochrome C biogenesis